MQFEKIISKMIDLQDKANAHTSEYLKLQNTPGKKSKASSHQRKAIRLRTRIQELIRRIAVSESTPPSQ